MYALAQNRVFKVFVMLLLVVTLTVVPTENKLQNAKTAYAVAIVDDAVIAVVVGVLVGMGLWSAYKNNSTANDWFGGDSMRGIARKIIDNVPDVAAWAASVGTGLNINALINVPQVIYKLIKEYLENTYDDVDDIKSDVDCVSVPGTILLQGHYIYPESYVESNPALALGLHGYTSFFGDTVSYTIDSYDKSTKLYRITVYRTRDSDGLVYDYKPIFDTAYLNLQFLMVYDDERISFSADKFPCSVYIIYNNGYSYRCSSLVSYNGAYFSSQDEYLQALQIITGDNGLRVDESVYNAEYAPYIKYYQDIDSYMESTAEDITSIKATLDDLASNVVNTATQTIHWTGGITDCPIDDLKSQLEDLITSAPSIGDWTCSWDKSGTLCDISVTDISTGETVADISSDVAISWTDVATEIGVSTDAKTDTDVDTDSKVDTDTKTDTGELTMPDDETSINFKPLQLAGELFTTRFPFCLPFDLYNAFTQFKIGNGSKKAPVITIPIDLSDFGYYEIELDLSVFDDNAVLVVRWSTYLSFVVLMIYVTNKLIGRG